MDVAQKTILLVEDAAFIAMREAQQLQKEGYAVVQAYNGEEAITKVEAASPIIDLILMDINLGPGIDGTEAAQIILQSHDIPIVFLSSHTDPEVVAKAEKITSYGYVVKDTGITVLAASIKMAFKLHDAHQTIRQTNESLRLAQAASHAGTWDWDIAYNTFNWSPEFLNLFGMPPNTIASFETWMKVVHPDDREGARRDVQEAIDNKTELVSDSRIVLPDGNIRWIQATGKIYYDGDQPLRMIGLCTDITERKQAEEELKHFFNLVPSMVCIASTDGYFERLNTEWERVLGYTQDELLTTPFIDFIHPDDRAATHKEVERLIAGHYTSHFINRYRAKDGTYRWFEWNATPSPDGTALFAAARDITDREQVEEQLRERDAQLKTIMGNTAEIILWVDKDGIITFANRIMPGLTEDDVIGSSIYKWVPEEQYPVLERAFKTVFSDGSREGYESSGPGPYGQTNLYDVQVVPVIVDGKTDSAIYTARDITERKQTNNALQQALAEKETLMRELQHRVKNSLSMAASVIELELDNLPDDRTRAIFNNTRNRLRTMSILYNRLNQAGSPNRIDLHNYLQTLIEMLSDAYLATSSPVTIEPQFVPLELGSKQAVPLVLIVNELLINALRHAFPAGRAGIIRVELLETNKKVTLCVTDNGVGMVPNSSRSDSPGLGLKLVKILTRQLGGELTIEGKQGVTVRVTFEKEKTAIGQVPGMITGDRSTAHT